MKAQHKLAGFASALAISFFATAASAEPTSMQNVMAVAIDSNPQIHQAEMNKQAIEFELEQAKGLYLPRVTLELSAGVRRLENSTRRALGIANDELYPLEAGIRAEQTLIDFGRRRGEKLRQAARVDGAALRVVERSEFIALQSARQYLDVLLQQRVVAAAEDNMTFHNSLVSDLSSGVTAGSISVADLQQAQERAKAASVRVSEAKEALQNARIELLALSGLDVDEVQMPPAMAEKLPASLSEAVGLTRSRHPKVLEAQADVDAANAEAKKAKGDFAPTIGLELSGRIGDDIDAFRGETNDLLGRVVLRWDIFDGGINRETVEDAGATGVDIFVVGSALFVKGRDMGREVRLLRALADVDLRHALVAPAFARAIADPGFARAIASVEMRQAFGNPGFAAALSSPRFGEAMRTLIRQ